MTVFNQLKKGPLKVSIIGGGNWGTAISKCIAQNCAESFLFDSEVYLWALEKEVEASINERNVNEKYLDGIKLPENLKCSTDLKMVTARADLLVCVVPHQFLVRTLETMKSVVKPTAHCITLIKGLEIANASFTPKTFSCIIEDVLKIPCCCLSGANVATDVAKEQFSETTIGYDPQDADVVAIWQQLFDRPDFRVRCIPDRDGVEVNGAIKNVVAVAAGFCDGLGLGTNAKSALIRIGAQEVRLFCAIFFPNASTQAFFESCGFADLITTCFGGRNVRVATEFVKRGGGKHVEWKTLEAEMLNGMFLQGTLTTQEVAEVLNHYDIFDFFPLFKATYEVAFEKYDPDHLIQAFRDDAPASGSILTEGDLSGSTVRFPAGLREALEAKCFQCPSPRASPTAKRTNR